MNDVELVGRLARVHIEDVALAIRSLIGSTLDSIKRVWHVLHSILTVTKRHVPKWLAGVLTVCLFIPGPLDEFLVLIVIGVMVKFKPAMRSQIADAVRSAWKS